MKKTAAIYCRISDDRTGQAAGVKRQEEDCRALAARSGWEVGRVFVDNDVSAYNGKVRPQYAAMLEDLRAGKFGVVLAWHPDRLHRRPAELETFIEILEAVGATVATVQAGELDLGTPSGRMVARMLGAAARHEGELKAARQRRKHAELARAGKGKGGGTRPFGFQPDRETIREDEAALICEASDRILLGASLRSVCGGWNDAKVRTPAGRDWRSYSLRRVLLSGRIAGLREHHGQVVAQATWPAIIERGTHERLRRLLQDPHRTTNGGALARRYLLTGYAVCGLCGHKLVARPRADGRRSYTCASGTNFAGCGRVRSLAEPLEDLVAEAIFTALDSPELTAEIHAAAGDGEEAELVAELEEDERALEQLAVDHYAERLIDRAGFLAAKEVVERRLDANRAALARLTRTEILLSVPSGAEALRSAWAERDIVWRRAVLRTVLERVTLNPAVKGRTKFDPERVDLRWRA